MDPISPLYLALLRDSPTLFNKALGYPSSSIPTLDPPPPPLWAFPNKFYKLMRLFSLEVDVTSIFCFFLIAKSGVVALVDYTFFIDAVYTSSPI